MSRLLLILLLCATLAQTYLVLELKATLVTPHTYQVEAMLETPITATKNGIQITTTVTTYQLEGETDEEHAARHLAKVEANIAALEAAGWTIVSS